MIANLDRRFLGSLFGLILMTTSAFGQTASLTPDVTTYAAGGGTVNFTASISYSTQPTALGFVVELPDGWRYTGGANEPSIKPDIDTSGTLEWAYSGGFGAESSTFTFTVNYPASLSGNQTITASAIYRTPLNNLAVTPVVLTPSAANVAPDITTQPQPQTVTAGGSVTLSVTATGTGLNYQWRKNGIAIIGATNSSLVLGNLQTADAGLYDVVIVNTGGSVISRAVMVSPTGNSNTRTIDPAFARPQFKRSTAPSRVISDGAGGLLATGSNGYILDNVAHQRRDGVLRLNAVTGVPDANFSNAPVVADTLGTAVQPDGRILVAGRVAGDNSGLGGTYYHRVVRYFPNGTFDESYRSPITTGMARFMAVQSDGKLLLSAGPSNTNPNGGIDARGLVRLDLNGSLDTTFTLPVVGGYVFAPPVVDANGKILIGGVFTSVNGVTRPSVARLNADGTLDTGFVPSGFTFSGQVRGIGVQSTGKVVLAGGRFTIGGVNYSVIRLNTDGSLDPSFTLVPTTTLGLIIRARMMKLQSDDKIVFAANKVIRLNADGTIDPSYMIATLSHEVFWMELLPDGAVVAPTVYVSGFSVNGTPVGTIFRLNASGALDPAFNPGPFASEVYPSITFRQSDSRVLVAGGFDEVNGAVRKGLARFNADGTLDATYGHSAPADVNRFEVSSAALTADNRVYATAWTGTGDFADTFGFYHVNADGTLDTGFVPAPSLDLANRSEITLTGQNDKPVLSGNSAQDVIDGRPFFKRLNSDGSVDTAFVSGLTTPLGTVTREGGFIGTMAVGSLRVLIPLSGGGFLASATTGSYPTINTTTRATAGTFSFTLLQFGADGALVAGFAAPIVSGVGSYVSFPTVTDPLNGNVSGQPIYGALYPNQDPFTAAATLADGRVVVAGKFTSLGGQPANGLARLLASGAIDTTFNAGTGPQVLQRTGVQPRIDCLRVRSDGKLILTGYFDTFNGCPAGGIVRLNADGSVDTTFLTDVNYYDYQARPTAVLLLDDEVEYLVGQYHGSAEVWPSALTHLAGVPVIATQPVSTTATAGGSVTLSVNATGAGLSYQWFKNATAISDATSTTLTLNNLTVSDTGIYTVAITNASGTSLSNAVTLTVLPTVAPSITAHPQTQRVSAGASFTLTVGVAGTAPFSYQWKLGPSDLTNGGNISGATSATLTIANVQPASAGSYTCVVTNAAGSASSSAATLTVNPNFNSWRSSSFAAMELLDPSLSGPNAIFGADGLPNLVKYALGLDPKTPAASDLPEVKSIGSDWTYTYTRPADRSDLTFAVEVSTNLATWTTVGVTHEMIAATNGSETWRARHPISPASNLFFRLKVSTQ